MKFTLNRKAKAADVLHIEHPHEKCNTDSAKSLKKITQDQAISLLDKGSVQLCGECEPDPYAGRATGVSMQSVGTVVNPPE